MRKKGMPFNDWLMKQNNRDDAIGRLAYCLQRDSTSPLWSSDLAEFNRYFTARNADAALIETFAIAIAEWKGIGVNPI